MTQCILILGGPTASGKTALACELALNLNTEVISADSRQFYKELNIGVARPPADILQRVRHHFIASHSIHRPLNAASYAAEAEAIMTKILSEDKSVVLCGGTGLYIKALMEGLDELPQRNDRLRDELSAVHKVQGITALQDRLKKADSGLFDKTDIQNPVRLIRAIEIAEGRVTPVAPRGKKSWPVPVYYFYLNPEREVLYQRINKRVEEMVEQGFEAEARGLYAMRDLQALHTVGYTEFFNYFDGTITRARCISEIQQHTRNYAKRQVTWFKNSNYIPVAGTTTEQQIDFILNSINK